MSRKLLLTGFIILLSNLVFSQGIDIVYPSERMVVQRNNSNFATVNIAGNFHGPAERIDVKLNAIQGGVSQDWTPIQFNPTGGIYRGNLNIVGGWYSIEIRQIAGGQVIATSFLQKFGVGEVLLIAGQSNAQGYQNFGNPPAFDDRVNYINNYFNGSFSDATPPYPGFGQLTADAEIAPFGQGSWAYGRLGDLLASKLNVPVLFINAAWEGSAVEDWIQSANGGVRFNVFTGSIYPRGMPFANLKNSLQYYTSLTGFRSIIWHQGESDQFAGTTGDNYLASLQRLILKTREITGKNVSWLVCRVSKYAGATSLAITNAQTNIVFNTPNVFLGPNTDEITERVDGVHFGGQGLVRFAEQLNASLNDNFFASSVPYSANTLLNVATSCSPSNVQAPIQLAMQDGFNSYSLNQTVGQFHSLGNGFFRGQARDQLGNFYFTQEIRYSQQLVPPIPTIFIDGAATFCAGKEPTLYTSNQQAVVWNDQVVAASRKAIGGGNYFGRVGNEFGCSVTSNVIAVTAVPSPPGPDIFNIGATNICPGQSAQLSTNTNSQGYFWSNGAEGKVLTTQSPGDYSLSVVDANGCRSSASNSIRIGYLPTPQKPIISADSMSFCPGQSVQLRANSGESLQWNSGERTSSIRVNSPGTFYVTATNAQGCIERSDDISVQVLTPPAKPLITPIGNTTFCKENFVDLDGSLAKRYEWSNGRTERYVRVTTESTLSVAVYDDRGCKSVVSDPIRLNNFPVPAPPVITFDKLSICPGQTSQLSTNTAAQTYIWSTGYREKNLSVQSEGDFTLSIIDGNGCLSGASAPARVRFLPLPIKPTIQADSTSFCPEKGLQLQTSSLETLSWNSGQKTQKIRADRSDTFTVTATNAQGCSLTSDPISVQMLTSPPKPVITPIGSTTYCKGTFVDLMSTEGFKYEWSNGRKEQYVRIREEGNFTVSLVSDRGCKSLKSDPIQMKHFPLSDQPVITFDSLNVCPGNNITLTSSKPSGNIWSTGETTKSIRVASAGTFSVKILSTEGCDNSSEVLSVKLFPAVEKPTITYTGKNNICEGDTAKLLASTAHRYIWNNNNSSQVNFATKTGVYSVVAVDKNGCKSVPSNNISINSRSTPSNPSISQIGSYTLEGVQAGLPGSTYEWRLNKVLLDQKTAIIKAGTEGEYDVRSSIEYSLPQNQKLTCYSKISEPYKFAISSFDTGMGLYPNPSTNGIVYIETREDVEDATINLIDSKGQIVFEAYIEKMLTRQVYDFSNLARGLYLLRIKGKNYTDLKRLLLEY